MMEDHERKQIFILQKLEVTFFSTSVLPGDGNTGCNVQHKMFRVKDCRKKLSVSHVLLSKRDKATDRKLRFQKNSAFILEVPKEDGNSRE